MAVMDVFSAIVPIMIPFVVGLITGLLLKTALKMAVGVVVVAVLLSWAGYSVPDVSNFFRQARSTLPQLLSENGGYLHSLASSIPYTTPAFVVGLALGIWWS